MPEGEQGTAATVSPACRVSCNAQKLTWRLMDTVKARAPVDTWCAAPLYFENVEGVITHVLRSSDPRSEATQ